MIYYWNECGQPQNLEITKYNNNLKEYLIWHSTLSINIYSLACYMQNSNIFIFYIGVQIQ